MLHYIFPLLGTLFYLLCPIQNLNKNNMIISTYNLRSIIIVHNFFLATFSAYIFINLFKIIYTEGIVFESNYYFKNPDFDHLIYLFYLSKYYEYIDTFILYLQNKNPIFLQKFHHVGAVICWHLCYYNKVDCIWMASILNAFVHTFMYTYYLLSIFKINSIYKYKKYITLLQIVQLTSANIVSPYLYFPPIETIKNYSIIIFFNTYVLILIYLFIQFSYKSYLIKK